MSMSELAKEGKKRKAVDEISDIVPSGLALNVAAGWLGISDVGAELKHGTKEDETAKTRFHQQQAGLGYVGSKHTSGLAGLEHRLANKVKNSWKKRNEQDASPAGHHTAFGKGGRESGSGRRKEEPKEDTDSESDGRGAAFGKIKKSARPERHSRAELLATSGGKKKKKKRAGKAVGGGKPEHPGK